MLFAHRRIFIAFAFLLTTFSLAAQTGSEVLSYTTNLRYDKGKLLGEYTYLIQINDKQSDWASNVEIPYSKGEKLEILEAHVLDAEGRLVRSLKKKEIITRSAVSHGSFHEDNFVKEFKLKWHVYPYQIRYSYSRQSSEFLYLTKWYPVIDSSIPTRNATLTVQVPLHYAIKLNYSPAFSFSSDTLAGNCTHKWQIAHIDPTDEEAYSPPLQERIPSVSVTPQHFVYGTKGSFESWSSYGNWLLEMNQALDILPITEQNKVEALIRGTASKKEVVQVLYHYMQDNTRYINVAIDLGGMKPYPASYVSANKYGDCKALTIYMKALLKHAGIESFYTDVHAGDMPVKIKTQFPAQQFNHVILCVPLEKDTLWLENTANHLPYNYLGTFTQNRQVLVVSSNSKLVRTPGLSAGEVTEKTTAIYQLNSQGQGLLHYAARLKGESFEHLSYVKRNHTEKEQLEEIKKKLPAYSGELKSWKMGQPHRDSAHIDLAVELQLSQSFRRLGNSLVISSDEPLLPRLEKPAARKSPVRIPYPVNKTDSVVYRLDFIDQYQVKLPQNLLIESKYGQYQEEYQLRSGHICFKKTFQLHAAEYSLAAYPELYAFLEEIRKAKATSAIVLTPSLR